MRGRVVIGFLMVLLSSFAGRAVAGEPWLEPVVNECVPDPVVDPTKAAQAVLLKGPLDDAIFLAGQMCTTVADCDCPYQPACYCVGTPKRCLCNSNICCPEGECP